MSCTISFEFSKLCIIIETIYTYSAAEVEQRLEILSFFVSFGYNELNHLNYGVIQKLVLHPLLSLPYSF